MKQIHLIFTILIALFLTACGSDPVLPSVPKTDYIVVKPSADMMKRCHVTPPPPKEGWDKQTEKEIIDKLFQLSSSLYGDLKICNERWDNLPQWFVDQQKVYSK